MDAATPHAVIAPAGEGQNESSASCDDLYTAQIAAIGSLRQRRTDVAAWLAGISLDRLEALLPRIRAAPDLLDVFAEGEYDKEQQRKARALRLNDILQAIENATDISEELRIELTKLFTTSVDHLVIEVEFRRTYLETAITARRLLPSSFSDEIDAIYAKYDISSSYTWHPLGSARPLIKVRSSRWDVGDIERNSIVSNLSNLPEDMTSLPETMKDFRESVVDAKRTLYLDTNDESSRQQLAKIYALVGEVFFRQHYDILYDADGVGDVATSQNELALLYYGVEIASHNVQRARAGPKEIFSEFSPDAIWVSPLTDQVWLPDRGYNRNVSSPYPIMFTVQSEQQQQYHYYPEVDIKVSGSIGDREFFKFFCEYKPSSSDTSSHLHDILNLCWIGFHNLHQATYKQKEEVRQATVFPSMFHANGIMKLFLCGFCATEQVHFFCARQYDCGFFQEAFQLIHNLLNLRDHQYGIKPLEDQEEAALQPFLKTAMGKSLNSTQQSGGIQKRTRASTGNVSGRSKRPRTGSAAESEAEIPSEHFFPVTDAHVTFIRNVGALCRRRGIEIDSFNGNLKIVPSNRKVRTAEWRGKPLVLKFVPRRSTELSFLLLLNSDDMRSRPGNWTIELLNHFAVDDEFDCLVLPRVSRFDEAPAVARLAPSEMLSLAQQAREYAAFLESVGLVHRDLKLENVGFLPGRAVVGAGDMGVQLVVQDLGRMERRNPSDLVQEYYVPREYCPREFFRSSEGCSPFIMDAFAAGVIATEIENKANARRTKTGLSVDA